MAAKEEGERWVKEYLDLLELQGFYIDVKVLVSIGSIQRWNSVSWWPNQTCYSV